jgi:hypothetical protein
MQVRHVSIALRRLPVLLPSLPSSGSLMSQTKASHYGKKPYKCRTVSNRGDRKASGARRMRKRLASTNGTNHIDQFHWSSRYLLNTL